MIEFCQQQTGLDIEGVMLPSDLAEGDILDEDREIRDVIKEMNHRSAYHHNKKTLRSLQHEVVALTTEWGRAKYMVHYKKRWGHLWDGTTIF